jgi:hypothetical protein
MADVRAGEWPQEMLDELAGIIKECLGPHKKRHESPPRPWFTLMYGPRYCIEKYLFYHLVHPF